jgi:hypothetical protein
MPEVEEAEMLKMVATGEVVEEEQLELVAEAEAVQQMVLVLPLEKMVQQIEVAEAEEAKAEVQEVTEEMAVQVFVLLDIQEVK